MVVMADEQNSLMVSHTALLRVRYADTDKMQVVYNGVYLEYFEVGRTEMLRACGIPYAELEQAGYLLPVLEAFVQYKAPARYDDILSIQTTYNAVPSPLMRIEYTILRDTTIIATGFTVHSFVKAGTMQPVKPPKLYVDAVNRYFQTEKQPTGEQMIR